jgi:hypothetical protein
MIDGDEQMSTVDDPLPIRIIIVYHVSHCINPGKSIVNGRVVDRISSPFFSHPIAKVRYLGLALLGLLVGLSLISESVSFLVNLLVEVYLIGLLGSIQVLDRIIIILFHLKIKSGQFVLLPPTSIHVGLLLLLLNPRALLTHLKGQECPTQPIDEASLTDLLKEWLPDRVLIEYHILHDISQ